MARMLMLMAFIAVLAASCGGDSDSTTTALNTTSSVADTTTTVEAPGEIDPVLITFDGAACSVSGGPLEPGLTEVSVLNTSPNPGFALIINLTNSYELADVAADVAAGRYDRNSADPVDIGGYQNKVMSPNATEPTSQPFTATTGDYAVLCIDSLEDERYLAGEVLEVS